MVAVESFRVQVYGDGVADVPHLQFLLQAYPWLNGFTTNPSLMRQAGVKDYASWARTLLDATAKPISFEVLGDDWPTIERQARVIHSWGENAFVKVPIQTTQGESLAPGIRYLSLLGVKVNVTGVFTLAQIDDACSALVDGVEGIISVFAGRIADTGLDPREHIGAATMLRKPGHAVLWASTRQVYDVQQADEMGADIITCSPAILSKIALLGKSLDDYSQETIEQFYLDGQRAGYVL